MIKAMKVTLPNNSSSIIAFQHIYEVKVSAAGLITEFTYDIHGNNHVIVTVAEYDGTNNKYEMGLLTDGYIFSAYVANYKTR